MKKAMAASSSICGDNDVEEKSAAVRLIEEVVDKSRFSRSSKPGKKIKGGIPVRLYGSYEHLYAEPMKYRSEFKTQNSGVFEGIFEKALKQVSHATSRRSKGCESKFVGIRNKRVDERIAKMKTSKATKKFQGKSMLENKNTKQESCKSFKQDEVHRELRPRNVNRDNMQRKRKLTSLTSKDAKGTRKPEKPCKKHQLSSCPSNKATASSKLLQRSARRMRVMQSLALIAPVGLPFSSFS